MGLVIYMENETMIEQTIYNMLTENTGTHMLDSGNAYDRHWQRNQKKSIEDFKKEPEATLSFDVSGDWIYLDPTVSVFHKLTKVLEEDELCKEFNAMKVNKWDSENYYGLSKEGENFLFQNGFSAYDNSQGGVWNTYNFENCFSQVLQGCDLEGEYTCDNYVLLQIHQGADVRGGYTDAKLFLNTHDYTLIDDSCYFSIEDKLVDTKTKDLFNGSTRDNLLYLDYRGGEVTCRDGIEVDQDYIKKCAKLCHYKTIEGFI